MPHSHQRPHQPHSCLQRAECNFNSLTVKSSYIYTVLKLFWPFEGKHEADVVPGENEFDTPDLDYPSEVKVIALDRLNMFVSPKFMC